MTELPEDDRYRAGSDRVERAFEKGYRKWLSGVPAPPASIVDEREVPIGPTEGLSLGARDELGSHTTFLIFQIRRTVIKRVNGLLRLYTELLKRQGNQLSIANRRHLLREKTRKELSETRQHQWARIVDPLIKAHHEWDQEQTDIRSLFDGPWDDLERDVWRFENEMERGLAGPPRRQILHRTAVESGAGASQSQVPTEHVERVRKLDTYRQRAGLTWPGICERMGQGAPKPTTLRDYRMGRIKGRVSSSMRALIDAWIDKLPEI